MKTQEYNIEGMSCQHCVMAVEKELAKVDIEDCKVELGLARITYDESKIDEEKVIMAINESGYKVVS